jgi:copper chaperone
VFNQMPHTFVGATTFHVDGMTCQRCRDVVAEQISRVPGVTGVRTDVITGTVTVAAATPVDRVDVAAAVKLAGYDLRP